MVISTPVGRRPRPGRRSPQVRVQGGTITETPGGSLVAFKVSIEGPTHAPDDGELRDRATTRPEPRDRRRRLHADDREPTFQPGGALAQTVTVPALDDATFEADAETFTFTATNAANGQSAPRPGRSSTTRRTPSVVAIGDVTLNEGEHAAQVPAVLTVTLDKASTAADHRPLLDRRRAPRPRRPTTSAKVNKQLVFEAGKTSKTVSVSVGLRPRTNRTRPSRCSSTTSSAPRSARRSAP